ncbi:MAG: helix-turn-helix domain-containing protein [Thiobacillus sp.]
MENITTIENAPLAGEAKVKQLIAIRDKYKGDTRAEQGRRLLESLRRFPVSTLEARRYLDIMHPAGRVQELRESDNEIDTLRVAEPSEAGRAHSIAMYVLRSELQQ